MTVLMSYLFLPIFASYWFSGVNTSIYLSCTVWITSQIKQPVVPNFHIQRTSVSWTSINSYRKSLRLKAVSTNWKMEGSCSPMFTLSAQEHLSHTRKNASIILTNRKGRVRANIALKEIRCWCCELSWMQSIRSRNTFFTCIMVTHSCGPASEAPVARWARSGDAALTDFSCYILQDAVASHHRPAERHMLHMRLVQFTTGGEVRLPTYWAWHPQHWPQAVTLLLGDLSSETGLVLTGAQEKNRHCRSPCWGGWLNLKRRMMPGRKAKTNPITVQIKKPERSCFEQQGWRWMQPGAAAGLCSAPCSSAQSNHVPGQLAPTCKSSLLAHAYRCALSHDLHMQVPAFCKDISSPCSPWFIPQLLLYLPEPR